MTKIDINEILALEKRYEEINHTEFDKIVWMDGDKELEIRDIDTKMFRFCGLSNINFITMGFYLGAQDWED